MWPESLAGAARGTAPSDGSGLVGLADRLAGLDGQLRVESPTDGVCSRGGQCRTGVDVRDRGGDLLGELGHPRRSTTATAVTYAAWVTRLVAMTSAGQRHGGGVRPSSGNSVKVALISMPPKAAAGPGFVEAAVEQAVHQTERGAIAPPQRDAEFVLFAVGDMREVHHRRDDLAGDERVVVVERTAPLLRRGGADRGGLTSVRSHAIGAMTSGWPCCVFEVSEAHALPHHGERRLMSARQLVLSFFPEEFAADNAAGH